MKRYNSHAKVWVQLILIVVCLVFVSSCEEGESDQTKRLTVVEGEVGYDDGQLLAPGCTIIIDGRESADAASAPENSLAAVLQGDSVYFFYTGIRDTAIQLGNQLSINSLALYLINEVNAQHLRDSVRNNQTHALDSEWRVKTGLRVATEGTNQIRVRNETRRFAAIVESSGEPTILRPAQLYSLNLLAGFEGQGNFLEILPVTERVVDFANGQVDSYGSSFISRFFAWTGLRDEENLRYAIERNPEIMAKLYFLEGLDIVLQGITAVTGLDLGPIGGVTCLNDVAQSIVQLLVDHPDAMATQENVSNVFDTAVGDLAECVITAVENLHGYDANTRAIAGKLARLLFKLDLAEMAFVQSFSLFDQIRYDFYAPIRNLGTWVEFLPLSEEGVVDISPIAGGNGCAAVLANCHIYACDNLGVVQTLYSPPALPSPDVAEGELGDSTYTLIGMQVAGEAGALVLRKTATTDQDGNIEEEFNYRELWVRDGFGYRVAEFTEDPLSGVPSPDHITNIASNGSTLYALHANGTLSAYEAYQQVISFQVGEVYTNPFANNGHSVILRAQDYYYELRGFSISRKNYPSGSISPVCGPIGHNSVAISWVETTGEFPTQQFHARFELRTQSVSRRLPSTDLIGGVLGAPVPSALTGSDEYQILLAAASFGIVSSFYLWNGITWDETQDIGSGLPLSKLWVSPDGSGWALEGTSVWVKHE